MVQFDVAGVRICCLSLVSPVGTSNPACCDAGGDLTGFIGEIGKNVAKRLEGTKSGLKKGSGSERMEVYPFNSLVSRGACPLFQPPASELNPIFDRQ